MAVPHRSDYDFAMTKPPIKATLANLRLKRLMANGYLPAELPPPFTTVDFAHHAAALATVWDQKTIRSFWTAAEAYSVPRYGHARRKLSIVNPVNQLHVAHLISENWNAIKTRLERSKITEFRPQITIAGSGRAVPGINFDGVNHRRAEILSSYGRYVKTDVARFYPSVYTHSIPWALLGKDWVKANFKSHTFKNGFADQLDAAVRAGQQGQTVGLPIGPDTSRILSELIATEVEEIIRSTLPDFDHRSVRYVDDMLIGLREDEAVPNVLSHISSALYDYELELNAEKTFTLGVGSPHSPEWIHYIRNFNISDRKGKQCDELDSFFEQACYLADANHRENVMLFAAKRSASFELSESNIAHLTRWLLYSARRSPSCLSFVAEHLAALNSTVGDLPKLEIAAYIKQQIKIKADFAHTNEAAWLLFWAREIGLKIQMESLGNLTNLRSSVVAMLMLDMNQKDLIENTLDTSFWRSFANSDGLKSEMWLLSYEATKKGWWPKAVNHKFVSEHQFFAEIWARDIEFYDKEKKARQHIKSTFLETPPLPGESAGFQGYPD